MDTIIKHLEQDFLSMIKKLVFASGGWLAIIGIMHLIAAVFVRDFQLLPPPLAILEASARLVADEGFYDHLIATASETIISSVLGMIVGIPLGLVIGSNRVARRLFEAPVDWFRSVPATALFPAMLLIFGVGQATRISIAVYGSIFILAVTSMYGAASADSDRKEFWKQAGLGAAQRFTHLTFWESLSAIMASSRLALSAALVLIVVGEMFIGAQEGLGYLVIYYKDRYNVSDMYGTIVLIGLFGYLLNLTFRGLEVRVVGATETRNR